MSDLKMNTNIKFCVSNDPQNMCHTTLMQNFYLVTQLSPVSGAEKAKSDGFDL